MTARPIIFSGPMIRALLDGRKTQTRRVLKPQPCPTSLFVQTAAGVAYDAGKGRPFSHIKYTPGDRLWVREAWQAKGLNWGKRPSDMMSVYGNVHYAATDDGEWLKYWGTWKPSIHMPRWASRLTLTVTDVRVQRVQEISKEDAISEGVGLYVPGHGYISESELRADPGYSNFLAPKMAFAHLWDSINAKRGFGWDANPWVVALTFTVHRRNIDKMGEVPA